MSMTATTIPYTSLTTMAEGMDAYCAPCGDFYIYECPDEECGGTICVCCMDSCEECGREVVFSS